MIVLKISTGRIAEEHLYKGEKGTYLDLALHENKAGKDQYGNDGFVTQSVGKESRAQGVKGPIVGNWKRVGEDRPAQKPDAAPPVGEPDSEVPF